MAFGKTTSGLAQSLNEEARRNDTTETITQYADTLGTVVETDGLNQQVDARLQDGTVLRNLIVAASPRPIVVGDVVRVQRGTGGLRFVELWESRDEILTSGTWIGYIQNTLIAGRKVVQVSMPISEQNTEDVRIVNAIIREDLPAHLSLLELIKALALFPIRGVRDTFVKGVPAIVTTIPRTVVAASARESESLGLGASNITKPIYYVSNLLDPSWAYDTPPVVVNMIPTRSAGGSFHFSLDPALSERSGWNPIDLDYSQQTPDGATNTRYFDAVFFADIPDTTLVSWGIRVQTVSGMTTTVTWFPDTVYETIDSVTDATGIRGTIYQRTSRDIRNALNGGDSIPFCNIRVTGNLTRDSSMGGDIPIEYNFNITWRAYIPT